ncbi:MAG: hypothetical protein RLZZ350_671 [Verrucomicrobiota bacterium]
MNTRVLLALSLAVNLALGALFVLRKPATPTAPTVTATAEKTAAAKAAAAKTETAVVTKVQAIDWRAVESDDYKKYIANLRSVGCPEETIRDIIVADVNKLFEDRKKALKQAKAPKEKFKFWETGMGSMAKMMGGAMDEETVKANQALAAEKRALLKELLGVDIEEKPADLMASMMNPFESMLDFLPADKQTKVMELMQQYQAKMMKQMGDSGDGMKDMQKVQKDMEAEMAKILSPSEMEDYQLRLSQTAMVMRMQLDGFSPNEQEFRDMFKLQKNFDDQYSMFSMGDEDDKTRKAREAAQKDLDTQLKATLGDARYADYEREKDYDYKNIAKAVKREGLDKTVGVKVYDMKKAAQDEANKLRMDSTLSMEDRNAKLQLIRRETEAALLTTMGQKGYDSYQKSANNWLNNIYRTPKP